MSKEKDKDYNPIKIVVCGSCEYYDSSKSECLKWKAMSGGQMKVPFNSFCGSGQKKN